MHLRRRVAVFLFLLFAYSVALAQFETKELSPDQVRRAIPVLRAEIARLKAHSERRQRSGSQSMSASEAVVPDAMEGKVEPLSWLKQRSQYVVVPPGATYHAQCSREVSRSGLVQAIYSFGVAAGGLSGRLGAGVRPEEALKSSTRMMDTKGDALLKSTRQFYEAREIRYLGNVAPFIHAFVPRDESLDIGFMELNPYRVGPCAALATGPILNIHVPTASTGAEPRSSPMPTEAGEYKRAMQSSGLSENEYLNIIFNLEDARTYDGDASQLDAMDALAASMGSLEGDPEVNRRLLRDNATRRRNLALYRSEKAQLNPLLRQRISLINAALK